MISFIRLVFCSCMFAVAARSEVTFSSGPSRVSLLELYTSEGCSSCPPAEKWLGELRNSEHLWRDFVPVALHVNYWDHLGWRDVLASKTFTDREYAYAAEWGSGSVYTPCFVRNGAEWHPSGANPSADSAPGDGGTLNLAWVPDARSCRIDYTPAANSRAAKAEKTTAGYDVHVALLGSGIVNQVRKGENAGRELRHEFVALRLETATLKRTETGTWSATISLPPRTEITAQRTAVAGWIVKHGDLTPLQATGGWIEPAR